MAIVVHGMAECGRDLRMITNWCGPRIALIPDISNVPQQALVIITSASVSQMRSNQGSGSFKFHRKIRYSEGSSTTVQRYWVPNTLGFKVQGFWTREV